MGKRNFTTVCPLGTAVVEGKLHEGELFDVYRIVKDDRQFCLKTPALLSAEQIPVFTSAAMGSGTSIWGGTTVSMERMEAETWLRERILVAESERIRASNGAWNHEVTALGTWDGEPGEWASADMPSRFRPALITPYMHGSTLATLKPLARRRLFPRMLPALWDALSQCTHGDLSPDNIIVAPDFESFALVDPGVVLWSSASGPEDIHWVDHRLILSCTAASYPLLPPTYCPPTAALAASPLDIHLKALREYFSSFEGPLIGMLDSSEELCQRKEILAQQLGPKGDVSAEPRPALADLLASGILYYIILTDKHPFPDYVASPLWTGTFGECRRGGSWPESLTTTIVPPREHNGMVTEPEEELAMALLELRTSNREHLLEMSQRAAMMTKYPLLP